MPIRVVRKGRVVLIPRIWAFISLDDGELMELVVKENERVGKHAEVDALLPRFLKHPLVWNGFTHFNNFCLDDGSQLLKMSIPLVIAIN